MVEINKSEIIGEAAFVPTLVKGISGDFIDKSSLVHDELAYCKEMPWIRKRVRFYCDNCGMHHKVKPNEIICTAQQTPVKISSSKQTEGFELARNIELPNPSSCSYNIDLIENKKFIEVDKVTEKVIFFTPDQAKLSLYESTGKIAVAPINRLSEVYSTTGCDRLVDEIEELTSNIVQWNKLDSEGDDFQELVYQLLRLNDSFSNISPGGTGADQGKDGFCYQNIGRRTVKIMVQDKFNNEGSGINARDLNRMKMNANSHGCTGLLVATIKTTGDLETKLASDDFLPDMKFLDVWNGVEMKSRISQHPELIKDYFC
ncbi:hypothetical protein [Haladaptatus halobius]|uniref:hypothetical protein n=1 Tax=Haladaptatus halobius TaxID=2884875 RepID=UPI001D0A03A5|nr:hypothetical protein [Haladaptatus halobius]